MHPCPAVPEAVQFGNWMFMVWPNPMPNIGISTDWTILERSYTSAKPPRITVFLLPISNTFGWDRAQTVSVYSIGALCAGLAAPFVEYVLTYAIPL